MQITFYLKQIAKMMMQQVYMPALYRSALKQTKQVEKGLVLFADGHTAEGLLPFSMQKMHAYVESMPDYHTECFVTDFGSLGYVGTLRWIRKFMKRYVACEYIFICNNFLPVSSCAKRPETTVIQLWHSGGILKKSGYDTPDDIPKYYHGSVYQNYDMVTVSAPALVPIFTGFMRLSDGIVKATGTSRSDWYYDEEWNRMNQELFYKRYPQAQGKKVIMWAPTFRGNAGDPALYGMDAICNIMNKTSDRYFWLIKLHPHLEGRGISSNCDIPSERLLAVTDLMITDYSSILFDYMAYKRPFVLFAPDRMQYEQQRGFYIDYESFPTTIVSKEEDLEAAIAYELSHRTAEDIEKAYAFHMASCDGRSTERIWQQAQNCHKRND